MPPKERNSRGQYEHAGPFVLRIVGKSEVNIWHSLCHRLARHMTILDGLGLGSALSNIEGRYSDAGTHGLRLHAMHRRLCGTFGIYMSPRLGRHASITACVYSLRMWAIVNAKGMTDRSVGKPMVC